MGCDEEEKSQEARAEGRAEAHRQGLGRDERDRPCALEGEERLVAPCKVVGGEGAQDGCPRPGEQMGPWASRVREAYRQVQKALRRARVAKGIVGPSPQARGAPGLAATSGARPSGDDEEPTAKPESAPPKEGQDDSESSDDEDIWLQFQAEGRDHEVLPPEIMGWLLLRRAGLTSQQRLSVQSATNNSLIFDEIEVALRDQEEDLLAQSLRVCMKMANSRMIKKPFILEME